MVRLSKEKRLNGIVSALLQEDCVLFIGSGISLWSGLPSWNKLILELAEYIDGQGESSSLVRKEVLNGDLLQSASYGLDKLTKPQKSDFFRKAFRRGEVEPHNIHQQIMNLGPRCFITTNYDTLIEESLRKWKKDRTIDVVTNKQLTEMANIMHSKARDFVYKFHGDVGDVDSIILTREQYRILLPQGERHNAMEALKTLLVSRPVVYIGFGLRDPDFLYLRDILINTYKGNIRDHYAIMSDVIPEEASYWKNNYGINIISYPTIESVSGNNHSELTILLKNIELSVQEELKLGNVNENEYILSLIRYASKLAYIEKKDTEFIINISKIRSNDMTNNDIRKRIDIYDNIPVKEFLDKISEQGLLIGQPGSGKTYALKQAASILGNKMIENLSSENTDFSNMTIPVYIDLKMYCGNIENMLIDSLPQTISLTSINNSFKLKIFIDSFNEMPKHFRENTEYTEDFHRFFKKYSFAAIVIASRSTNGLENFNFPSYYLDEIDNTSIDRELHKRAVALTGTLKRETYLLLKKPLFFQYIISEKVNIRNVKQPKDFYEQLFDSLQRGFTEKFHIEVNVTEVLSKLAYKVLDYGDEAFPQEAFFENAQEYGTVDISVDIINWLISQNIILPYTRNRISFVHQSITEYLAALELAKQYVKDKDVLKRKMGLYRWDQALYLTLNLLPNYEAESFLEQLFAIDFYMASGSLKYVEYNRDELVNRALCEIEVRMRHNPRDFTYESTIAFDLPISTFHEPVLRKILALGNSIGGTTFTKLVELKGIVMKEEMEDLLLSHCNDYNFCVNGVGTALAEYIDEYDVQKLYELALVFEQEGKTVEEINGFISSIPGLTKKIELDVFTKYFITKPLENLSKIMLAIVCEKLRDTHTSESLDFLGELILAGHSEAITPLYFVSKFSKKDLSWSSFSDKHVDILLDFVKTDGNEWFLKALEEICNAREDLRRYVIIKIEDWQPENKLLIEVIALHNRNKIFDYLEYIIKLDSEQVNYLNFQRIKELEINWEGKDTLFLQLLKMNNNYLSLSLMGGSHPPTVDGLSILEIDSIYECLYLLEGLLKQNFEENWWLLRQLSIIFTKYVSDDIKKAYVEEFNTSDSLYSKLLLKYIIPQLEYDVSHYNEHTIQYIIDDMETVDYSNNIWDKHMLIDAASEKFVEEKLLPLLSKSQGILNGNLRYILKEIGKKYGKRYII